jgi:hypothetical protein
LLLEVRDYYLQLEIVGVAMWQSSSLNEPFEDALVALKSCTLCFEKKLCISLYSMCFGILSIFTFASFDYLLQFLNELKSFCSLL